MSKTLDMRVSHWYALYTRPRFEKKVYSLLLEKGFESYLPLHMVLKQWSDRLRKVEEPLFSCYVFVRMALREKVRVVETHGVVRMVSFGTVPAAIADHEIVAVRKVLSVVDKFESYPYMPIGQDVEVISGPLTGIRGRLLERRRQHKLVVGIQQIRQAISVELNAWDVRAIELASTGKRVAYV